MVGGKWTCYRRNYLKIDAVVKPVATIERKEREGKSTIYDPITDTHYQKRSRSPSTSSSSDSSLSAVPPSSTMLPEQSHRGRRNAPELFVTLTTHVADQHGEVVPRANEVSLVQFGPERERGTKTSVQPHTIVAGGSLSASTGGSGTASAAAAAAENASNVATFRRVQVRRATSKNGRLGDDSEQQYFILRLSLYTPSNSGFAIVREDDNHHQSAPSAPRHEEEDAPPPSKRPRRSATSAGAASASASTAGAGPSTYSRLEQQEEGTYASSPVHPQWVLLASLDSAPVTIRGRSRKHFAANVDSGSASTSTRMQRS
ncbi:hypothetical protein OC845_003235 [Tilletia horrida]|nr:hypothetical protein OC845_003235 [Tilletia horrida]